jgi:hypothetical protein
LPVFNIDADAMILPLYYVDDLIKIAQASSDE